MTALNVGHFAGSGMGLCPKLPMAFCGRRVPKRPTGFAAHDLPLSTSLSRHFPYHSDKLSRLALPSELSGRRLPCGIKSLAESRTLGAHFAEAIGVLPFSFSSPKTIRLLRWADTVWFDGVVLILQTEEGAMSGQAPSLS
jgi:hypothetical protein